MLTTLWQWWTTGLGAPWPRAVRERLRPRRRRVWADQTGNGFEFVTRRGDGWRTLWTTTDEHPVPARVRRRLGASRVVLRLPQDCALERTVTIPPDTPATIYVGTRLEELTPFPAEQACFDVMEDPGEPGTRLIVAQKSEVDKGLQRLRDCGLRAEAVTVEGYEHTSLDLLPAGQAPPARPDTVGGVLLLAGALLCATVIYLPLDQQQRVLEALSAEKTRLEQRFAQGQDVREQIRSLRARAATIAERRASRPDVVTLLADVTDVVPDHSWVRHWVLHEGRLTLHGESSDTADLIARLEASPLLRNVRYDAAITRDTGSGKDRFKLSADTGHDGS